MSTGRVKITTYAVMVILITLASFQAFCQKPSSEKEAPETTSETVVPSAQGASAEIADGEEPKATEQTELTVKATASASTVVYYFHTTGRCYSCNVIQNLTKTTIEEQFSEQIKSERVHFKPVNIDLPENKHFITDYKLYTKSVIISDLEEGKEKRWKNLDQVWRLLRNENQFKEYITNEVNAYLKG